jgi:hypothetical protein
MPKGSSTKSKISKRSDFSLHIRVSTIDVTRLRALVKHMEMTQSQVVRVLLRDAAEKMGAHVRSVLRGARCVRPEGETRESPSDALRHAS